MKIRKISFTVRLIEYAIILHNFLELNNNNLEDLYDKNNDSNSDDNSDGNDDSDGNNNKSIIRALNFDLKI